MPLTTDKTGPYAPPSALLSVINRRRDRGLNVPINQDVLTRAGISESLIPRTLQSLQTLDLIDEAGQPTATFEALRLAPSDQLQARMQEWLKSAYAEVFAFVDPAQDDETKIGDAFRAYNPVGQQRRMVILFRDLCTAAGLAPSKQSAPPKPSAPRITIPKIPNRAAAPSLSQKLRSMGLKGSPAPSPPMSGLPPALSGLLASLPNAKIGWTEADRDAFMKTFEVVLNYSIPIKQPSKNESGDQDEVAA